MKTISRDISVSLKLSFAAHHIIYINVSLGCVQKYTQHVFSCKCGIMTEKAKDYMDMLQLDKDCGKRVKVKFIWEMSHLASGERVKGRARDSDFTSQQQNNNMLFCPLKAVKF